MEDTELHVAVRLGDPCDVEEALGQGLDANQIGLYDWSPLHEASFNGNLEIVEMLLKFKGDPNQPDGLRGFTAVHHAASEGHIDCLQCLINTGGQCHLLDNEGRTSLDVARGKCIELLQSMSKIKGKKEEISKSKSSTDNQYSINSSPRRGSKDGESDCEYKSNASSIDFDRISITSGQSGSSVSSWNSGVLDFHTDLVMGNAVMSFEYNKKAMTFKIRIWELQDLILPPVETSMIQDIFVRSFLLPDKNKKTKRNTENISASKLLKSAKSSKEFSTVTIKFSKALEYKDITQEIVEERMVYLEIHLRQKYTWRNFVLATWNTPMNKAVTYLMKEKYPLTPKVSTTIPSNMRVYSAHKLHVPSNRELAISCPNSQTASVSSLHLSFTEPRASSDPNLQTVSVHAMPNPSIQVSVPTDEENDSTESLDNVITVNVPDDSLKISMETENDEPRLESLIMLD